MILLVQIDDLTDQAGKFVQIGLRRSAGRLLDFCKQIARLLQREFPVVLDHFIASAVKFHHHSP